MQIPTFENLPTVAPSAPEVRPQAEMDRFQRQELEKPGEALGSLGQSLAGVANEGTNIVANMAAQQQADLAKTQATQHQGYVNNLLFKSADGQGGPAFYAMKGQDAVNAAPGVIAAIQAQRDQAADGMSPLAKRAFLAQTDGEIQAVTGKINDHVMLQAATAATSASQARLQSAADTGVLNYNDPAVIASSAQTIHSEAADEARRNGWLPNADGTPSIQQAQYEKAHLSNMYRGVVETALGKGDVSAAAKAMNAYGPQMTGPDFVHATEITKGPFLKANAQQQGDTLIGPQAASGVGMDQPYRIGGGYYDAVHGGEGNGTNAKTGATGPVQVIPSTLADFRAAGHNDDIHTEAGGRAFTQWYGDQNAQKISAVTGQPATMGQVVSAHLLGPGGATSILSRPDEPIGKTLGEEAVRNNPGPLPGGVTMTGREAQKSISDYYTKAAGNQFAGPGVPTAASVAAEKPARPDFEGAIGRVPDDPKDPDLHNATVAYINERKNTYDMGETVERKHLDDTVIPQTLDALKSGAVDTTIPELAIRRAHNSADADKIMGEVADARQFGNLLNQNKYASADDINTQLATLHAKVLSGSTDAAETASAVKAETMLQSVVAKRQEQLKADPWTYVRQEPSVAAAYGADLKDPSNVAKAVAQSEAVQVHLGAAPQALSTQAIQSNVAKIHQAPVEAVPSLLAGMRHDYGDAWPAVFRDLADPQKGKLDPLYQTFATIPQSGAVPIDYAAALKAKVDKGDKFGTGMKAQYPSAEYDLESRITSNMAPWQSSFQPGSGDGLIAGQRNSIRTLATYYADDRGMKPEAAADAAYKAVIGDNMTISGQVRAPKTMNGQPFSADMVQDAGRGVQNTLTDDKLQGVTAAQAKGGTWATDRDGMSATLQVKNTIGSWNTVKGADGKPVTMDYRRLPAAVAPAAATDAVGLMQ